MFPVFLSLPLLLRLLTRTNVSTHIMDDSGNPSFLISIPCREPPLSTETRFGNWICSVSQPHNNYLNLAVQCTQDQPVRRLNYSRLCIYTAPACDPASLFLEMPIRTSDVLLQGLRGTEELVRCWPKRGKLAKKETGNNLSLQSR